MRKHKGLALMLAAAMALNLCGAGGVSADAATVVSEQEQEMEVEQQLQQNQQNTEEAVEKLDEQQKKMLQEKKEERNRKKKIFQNLKKLEKNSIHSKKASEGEVLETSMSALVQEDGTFIEAGKDSQITISSGEELKYLSEYTNAGMNTQGVTFTQTEDIDCTGATMSAIGSLIVTGEVDEWGYEEVEVRYFQGVYDGGEKKLTNVCISLDITGTEWYNNIVALFGYLYDATVKNVVLESVDYEIIQPEVSDDEDEESNIDYISYAGIAGSLENSTLNNCVNNADITLSRSFMYLSGIALYGRSNSVIEACVNNGDLVAEEGEENDNWGIYGIANYTYGDVKDCVNNGDITNYYRAAGIIAETEELIENCKNTGKIQASIAAGISRYHYGEMKNCVNQGTILGTNYAGGISYDTDSAMNGCINEGEVISGGYAGGITSYVYTDDVKDCINKGSVTGEDNAGGICAYLSGYLLTGCTNEGKVSGTKYAGGIVGQNGSGIVSACINKGEVQSSQYAGGIVGAHTGYWDEGGSQVSNVQNFGFISSEQVAGGITGMTLGTNVFNSWNHGDVNGVQSAGGIVGSSDLMAYFEVAFEYDKEDDPEYYEEMKEWYQTEEVKSAKANKIANVINIGAVSSDIAAGAIIGASTVPNEINYSYYEKNSAQKICGGEDVINAEELEENEWNNETFIEILNQNIIHVDSPFLLTMKYDSEKIVTWGKAIVVDIRIYTGYDEVEYMTYYDVIEALDLKFALYHQESEEYIPMEMKGGFYSVAGASAGTYEVFRVLSDGSYQTQENIMVLAEDDTLVMSNNSVRVFQAITDISYEKTEEGYQLAGQKPYYIMTYVDMYEIVMPADPVKEGYTFGGWYSTPYVYSEELYADYKERMKQEFIDDEERYKERYNTSEWLQEEYSSAEEYANERLMYMYGYTTVDEYMAEFDKVVDENYRIDELIVEEVWEDYDEIYYYLAANIIYPKWIKNQNPEPQPTATAPAQTTTQSSIVYQEPDANDYKETTGSYVKKSGVIYKVDTAKKTAKVTGVTSTQVKKVTIQATVKAAGVKCKVTSIGKKAFANCKKLKKITVKGKNLKSVHKTALKGTKKKVTIKANKKIKKLFKKAQKNR